jgi:hypothetical protein
MQSMASPAFPADEAEAAACVAALLPDGVMVRCAPALARVSSRKASLTGLGELR